MRDVYSFSAHSLWSNTVYPATEADNWFVSGTAAYWNILNGLPSDIKSASANLRDQLTEMNCRLLYVTSREGAKAAEIAERRYDGFRDYLIPRIKGTFALHQLRLKLGNDVFSSVMNGIHTQFKEKPMKTLQFMTAAEKLSGTMLRPFVMQWLERDDIPAPVFTSTTTQTDSGWKVTINVKQSSIPYDFYTTLAIESAKKVKYFLTEIAGENETHTLFVKEKPVKITFNAGNDIPVRRDRYFTYSNFFDDFHQTMIVYGTAVSIEAQHTLALRYQTVLADAFTERLLPVMKESEVDDADLADHDIVLLGGAAENSLTKALAEECGLILGKRTFQWRGKAYTEPDDGLTVVLPNPQNSRKVICFIIANSALELHQMTKKYAGFPSWSVFKGEQMIEKGYHPASSLEISD